MDKWAPIVIAAFAAATSLYAVIAGRRKDKKTEACEERAEIKTEVQEKSEISVQMMLMLGEIRGISTTVDKIEKQTCRIEDRILDHEKRLVRIETLNKIMEE